MATNLSGPVLVAGRPLFGAGGDTVPQHPVGARVEANDGRVYRYCFVTPTAMVAGQLYQGPAQKTTHQDLTATAAAIGDTTLSSLVLGATVIQLNEYAGGQAVISVTPGVGYSYRIKSHLGGAASATISFTLEDAVEVALTATSRIDLVHNPYNGVIVNPTTRTGPVVGVAVDVITAGNYGWIQSQGPIGVLADGTIAVGNNVSASTGVAGAVAVATTATALLGWACTGIADTEYGSVYLTLD